MVFETASPRHTGMSRIPKKEARSQFGSYRRAKDQKTKKIISSHPTHVLLSDRLRGTVMVSVEDTPLGLAIRLDVLHSVLDSSFVVNFFWKFSENWTAFICYVRDVPPSCWNQTLLFWGYFVSLLIEKLLDLPICEFEMMNAARPHRCRYDRKTVLSQKRVVRTQYTVPCLLDGMLFLSIAIINHYR